MLMGARIAAHNVVNCVASPISWDGVIAAERGHDH